MNDMSVEVRTPGVLVLRGEIDNHGATLVAEWLDGTGQVDVEVVDCSEVTYFGAAGLTLLLSFGNGEPLPVIASSVVQRVIDICDLGDRLPPVDDDRVHDFSGS